MILNLKEKTLRLIEGINDEKMYMIAQAAY